MKGSPAVLRSLLGYVAASRAALGGQKAFMDATKYLVANMLRSMAKKLEIEMLYGDAGYGVVHAVAGGSPEDFPAITLGSDEIAIKKAEWAPGIWAGAEGMPIEIKNGASTTISAKVVSVNMETRVLKLDVGSAAAAAGQVIWHKGAYGNEFKGIHKILTNSGTIFNIDAGVYNLFRGNEYDAGNAALSFTKLGQAGTRAVEKGQEGTLLALVNPRGWQNMLSDQAALRKYDQSYSPAKMENGAKSLKFHSQNGEIEIEPSLYVKEGYAYLLNVEDWMRVGSTDITFKRPGQGEEFFRDLENSAAYELRLYTDQALFCQAPGRNTLIKNIVNS